MQAQPHHCGTVAAQRCTRMNAPAQLRFAVDAGTVAALDGFDGFRSSAENAALTHEIGRLNCHDPGMRTVSPVCFVTSTCPSIFFATSGASSTCVTSGVRAVSEYSWRFRQRRHSRPGRVPARRLPTTLTVPRPLRAPRARASATPAHLYDVHTALEAILERAEPSATGKNLALENHLSVRPSKLGSCSLHLLDGVASDAWRNIHAVLLQQLSPLVLMNVQEAQLLRLREENINTISQDSSCIAVSSILRQQLE